MKKWSLRFASMYMNKKMESESFNSTFESDITNNFNKVDDVYEQMYCKDYNLLTINRQKKNWKFFGIRGAVPNAKIPTISTDLHSVSKNNMKFFVMEKKHEKKVFKIHKSIRKKNNYMNYPFYKQTNKIINIKDFSSQLELLKL
jgi:hypothetical protein